MVVEDIANKTDKWFQQFIHIITVLVYCEPIYTTKKIKIATFSKTG